MIPCSKRVVALLIASLALNIIYTIMFIYPFFHYHVRYGSLFVENLGKQYSYICLGKLCVLYPKNTEYYLYLNLTNCNNHSLYLVPSKAGMIMSLVCNNSTLEKNVEKINYMFYNISR